MYQYYCEKCEHAYEEERPCGTDSPKKCPKCGTKYGKGFYQNYGSPVVYSFLEPKTFEQQSKANKKRIGKYKLEEMEASMPKLPGPEEQKAVLRTAAMAEKIRNGELE